MSIPWLSRWTNRKPVSGGRSQTSRFMPRLESLEERTLLSAAAKSVYPAPHVPVGLGTSYTTMSEQAHGIGVTALPWA